MTLIAHRSILTFLLGMLVAFIGTSAEAGICWIDHVEKGKEGLQLFFAKYPHMGVEVFGPQQGQRVQVGDGGVVLRVEPDGGRTPIEFLMVHGGDKLFLMQGVHDHCNLEVVEDQEKAGVRADSFMNLPGLPSRKVEEFFVAQRGPNL